MWLRANHPPAMKWWGNIRMEVKRYWEGKCAYCGMPCPKGDVHHTKDAYSYIGFEDECIPILWWVHRSCHIEIERKKVRGSVPRG